MPRSGYHQSRVKVHPQGGDHIFGILCKEQLIAALSDAVSDLAETDCSCSPGFKISEGLTESAVFKADGGYVLRWPTVGGDQLGSGPGLIEHMKVGTAPESARARPGRRGVTRQGVDESAPVHERIFAVVGAHAGGQRTG